MTDGQQAIRAIQTNQPVRVRWFGLNTLASVGGVILGIAALCTGIGAYNTFIATNAERKAHDEANDLVLIELKTSDGKTKQTLALYKYRLAQLERKNNIPVIDSDTNN